MKDFIFILQFLTRIPLPFAVDTDEYSFARGVVYFPMVGLMIGLFSFGFYEASIHIISPSGFLLAAILAVLGNLMITGGLHVDGLADTCDGIFSGRKRERILEIMKDSHIGTFGTIGIFMDLLLRVGLLSELRGPWIFLGIVCAPIFAKTAVVLLMSVSTYARVEGMGGFFLGKMKKSRIYLGLLLGMGLFLGGVFISTVYLMGTSFFIGTKILMTIGIAGLCWLLGMAGLVAAYRRYIYHYINGMTGDTVGAANEVFEWFFLLAVLVFGRILG